MIWHTWSLDRIVILFVGLAYAFIGLQVWSSHYRQNFHHKIMYVPVIEAPVFCVAAVLTALSNAPWLYNTTLVLLIVGVFSGLVGFYRHFKGVGVRVGGYELRNFLIGPPVILPLMFSAMGVLGLIAYCWRQP